jgi:formate-dependent nitrite reductase membrane component NrfD
MVERFTIELHGQREWAWLLALYLFFGSLGGWLFLLYRFFGLAPAFALGALGLVLLGVVTLLLKLGSPQRAWRAMFRPGTSWISRGVLFVAGFLLFGALSVAPALAPWIGPLSLLPWTQASGLGAALGWIAALLALATTIYPGFVVSSARAIPFWNTPLLPLVFFTYAGMAASGIVLAAAPAGPDGPRPIALVAAGAIVVNLVLLAVYLVAMTRLGGAAQESVRRLNRAPLAAVFWIGVVAVGLILPLALLWWPAGRALAGAGLLLGGLMLRYCILKAGVYVPAPLAPREVDFSKLNRTSAAFEREYAAMAAHGR